MGTPVSVAVGQVFSRLTVVARAHNGRDRNSLWTCQCACGNTRVVYGFLLKNGRITSCGRACEQGKAGKQLNRRAERVAENNENDERLISELAIKPRWVPEPKLKPDKYNQEFIRLCRETGRTKKEIAEIVGVSLDMVKQWTKSPSSKNFSLCPPIRFEMLRIWWGSQLRRLDETQRTLVLDMLKEKVGRASTKR